jgi:uncharacterized protein
VTAVQLIIVAAAVFGAAFVQAITGFGFGLLSVPVMTLAIDPKVAIVVASFIGAAVTSWQAWMLRHDGDRALIRRMIIPAYVGMPIGLLVYVTVDQAMLRFLLGCAVLLAVVLLVAPFSVPVGKPLDIGAGFLSGVLNSSLSTNGPPLVFALQARKLPPDDFRATILMIFALSNVVGLSLFVAAGKVDADGIVAAAVATPAMLLGQVAGAPWRRRVNPERFRVMVLCLLVVAALSAIAASLATG